MAKADLHIHTTASDGKLKPARVVELAYKKGLEVISITDHDTIAGYWEARAKAKELNLRLIPGVEITADFKGDECHLLAYCFNPEHDEIKKLLAAHQLSRLKRGKWIINQLKQQGLDLDIDEVKAEARGANIGRPHIANVLVGKGYVASFKEAFIRYLSDDALGDIYNEYLTHQQVIQTVKHAGGAVIIAHPANHYSMDKLQMLVEAGVDGIEFMHPSHNYKVQKRIEKFAKKHKLLLTGGSDFHGKKVDNPKFFGVVTLNVNYVDRLIKMTDQRKKITA